MQRNRLLLAPSCLTVLSLLLAGCAPALAPTPAAKSAPAVKESVGETPVTKPAVPAPTPKPAASASGGPKYGGTLNISHFSDPTAYDLIQETSLHAVSLVAPCYSNVVQHDPLEPTKVIGDLAEKWDMSPDGLAYTFHLQRNVKWHDGTPFTSEDARYSVEVMRKPPRGIVSPRQAYFKVVKTIEAPDKDTLKTTLEYPSASFLHNLGDGRNVIGPKHIYEAKGNLKKDVVGTGPYKFKSFSAGVSWSVVKNPDYFVKGRPYLDGITWYIISDAATRFAALRTHRVQATPFSSQGLTPTQTEIVQKELSDRIIVDTYPSLVAQAFWMPYGRAPWSDMRVRRAVELAIDRPNLVKAAAEGVAEIGGYISPTGTWSLPKEEILSRPGYRQPKDPDIAEAKRLMAEAGYAQGIKTVTITRNAPQYERMAVVLKEQLARIGIDVSVKLYDQATLYDNLYKRSFDTAAFTIVSSFDDPDQVFGEAFVTGQPRNFAEFSDERIDRWYDEQGRALDLAQRKEIVLNMQRRIFELLPCSTMFWMVYQLGRWNEVKNFQAGIGNYNNLKFQDVRLEK